MLKPWNEYVEGLKSADSILQKTWRPEDIAYRADVYRQIMMNLSLSYLSYFGSDPYHPDWTPLWNSVFTLQPNPDDVYLVSFVRSDSRYRVFGDRGSIHLLGFTVGSDLLGVAKTAGHGSKYFDSRSLEIGPDGRFEILLSRERPADFKGNWMKLDERDNFIIVRQRSYDWGNEKDSRIAIECLDAPSDLKPRMSAEDIAHRLDLMQGFSNRFSGPVYDTQNAIRGRVGVNQFEFYTFAEYGGVPMQIYWQAIFELDPGEALILETELPATRPYWNVQLNDPLFNAIDFIYRQSSLNGHTAGIDGDGKFRAVISHEDPGIANWLDPSGFTEGTVIGRWYDCSSQPLPKLRKVPFSEIRRHIPAGVAECTQQQRSAALRERRRGAQLRRRW